MNDIELLRTYEPILRFTEGELFFPCAVDGYLAASSLWEMTRGRKAIERVPEGKLSVDELARFDHVEAAHVLFIRFVAEPLQALEYQRWANRPERPHFLAPGRLARVPLISRIGDAFFDLSLALRGTVPGGTAAAAERKMRAIEATDSRRVYYARVVRDGQWIVLQYFFFYAMNNWRSGFFGVNDHEADWEQVLIYLYEDEANVPQPMWVAFASHDFKGDDLRRRWDDPLLYREGTHPIVFAGAGSHASYFEPGEYMMNIEPRFLTPVKNGLNALRRFWYETLQQGESDEAERRIESLLSVPFVDYARGDGQQIGPGRSNEWTRVLISDDVPWVNNYRGLWGLDTQDRFGGERAPSGPKYNRDGTIRMSWYDPLGWAGVDKLTPPVYLETDLQRRLDEIEVKLGEVDRQIDRDRESLRTLALDVEALKATDYFSRLHESQVVLLNEKQKSFQSLVAQRTELEETRLALDGYLARVREGDMGSPQSHIKHAHRPTPTQSDQRRAIEIWAAVSGALALMAFGYLLVAQPNNWIWLAVAVGIAFGAIDALARGRFAEFLLNVVIVLAIVAALILFIEFWQLVVILGLVVVVVYMIRDNLRELRG